MGGNLEPFSMVGKGFSNWENAQPFNKGGFDKIDISNLGKNKAAGVGDGLGSAMFGAGSLINAGTSLYGTINSVIQNRKALNLQKEQLELAETQYADEKARYDKRQADIDATNAAVGEAVQGWGESAKKETQNLPMNRI